MLQYKIYSRYNIPNLIIPWSGSRNVLHCSSTVIQYLLLINPANLNKMHFWDLRFSQQCLLRFKSSGMLYGVVNSYQHFGGAWCFHLLGRVLLSKKSGLCHLGCQTPRNEEKYFSKTLVTIYQSTQHNIPEDLNLHNVSTYSCVCAYFPSWNKQHSLLMEIFLLTSGAKLLNTTRISEWYYSHLY
jgi:hypothetical protein